MKKIEIPKGNGIVSIYKYDDDGNLISHSLVRKKSPKPENEK